MLNGEGTSPLSRLRRGFADVFLLNTCGALAAFGLHAFLGNVLGTEGYGGFSHALAVAAVLALAIPLGMPSALLRFTAEYKAKEQWGLLRGILNRGYAITLLSAASWLILGALTALALRELEALGSSIIFGVIIGALLGLLALQQKGLRGLGAIKASLAPQNIVLPILAVVVVLAGGVGSTEGALWSYALAAALVACLGAALIRRFTPATSLATRPEFRTRYWVMTAAPMMVGALFQVAMNRSDIIILGGLTEMGVVGPYSAAKRIAMLCTFGLGVVSVVAAPLMSSSFSQGRLRQTRRIMYTAIGYSTLIAVPAFVVMMAAPRFLLGLYGDEFVQAADLLRIMAAAQFVNAATGPVGFALLMIGQQNRFALTLGAVAAATLVAHVTVIPTYGALGAAVVTSLSVLCVNAWQLVIVLRCLSRTTTHPGEAAGGRGDA